MGAVFVGRRGEEEETDSQTRGQGKSGKKGKKRFCDGQTATTHAIPVEHREEHGEECGCMHCMLCACQDSAKGEKGEGLELLEEAADLRVRRKALCELFLVDGAVLCFAQTKHEDEDDDELENVLF